MNEFGKNLQTKSLDFAVRIAKYAQDLVVNQKEFVLSRQLMKSGTSIGANIREAQYAQSDADFVSKLSIALKEGAETQYWLEVLHRANFMASEIYQSLSQNVDSLVALLVKSVRSKKANCGFPVC